MKWTSNPALKCILNLIWSVRGSINADLKKGNVEQIQNSLFSRQLRKKREANQIQTESKACVTTSNFAAKARLLASVESCRNQFRRLV